MFIAVIISRCTNVHVGMGKVDRVCPQRQSEVVLRINYKYTAFCKLYPDEAIFIFNDLIFSVYLTAGLQPNSTIVKKSNVLSVYPFLVPPY